MSEVLTVQEAAQLAVATLKEVPTTHPNPVWQKQYVLDRDRIESDLSGLREHSACGQASHGMWLTNCIATKPCPDAQRYSDNLRRTAALYGIVAPGPSVAS